MAPPVGLCLAPQVLLGLVGTTWREAAIMTFASAVGCPR